MGKHIRDRATKLWALLFLIQPKNRVKQIDAIEAYFRQLDLYQASSEERTSTDPLQIVSPVVILHQIVQDRQDHRV